MDKNEGLKNAIKWSREKGGGMFSVGETYPEFRSFSDRVETIVNEDGTMILAASYQNVKGKEVRAFKDGTLKIALKTEDGFAMWYVEADGCPPLDAFYCPSHTKLDRKPIEPYEEGMGMFFTIILCEALTGEIKALRSLGLSHEMSEHWRKFYNEEIAKEKILPPEFNQRAQMLQNRYSTNDIYELADVRHTSTPNRYRR